MPDSAERAEKSDGSVDKTVYKTRGGVSHRTEKSCFCADFSILFVYMVKSFFRSLIIDKRTYELLISGHFFGKANHIAAHFRLLHIGIMGSLCNFRSCNKGKGSEQHHYKGDFVINEKHEYQRSDYSDNTAEKLRKSLKKSI